MKSSSRNCNVTVIGAGPYGLSAVSYLRAANIETRVFGEPMSFWQKQMPAGMCLRSSWGASHIADPKQELTLDAYCAQRGNHLSKPIPLDRFIDYGCWFQQKVAPDVDRRRIVHVDTVAGGLSLRLEDGEEFVSRKVVVATGIASFVRRPAEFAGIPNTLASHSSEHDDLRRFRNQNVVVIGGGQSALESAVLFKEAGIDVELIARQRVLNWVGLHPRLHHLGAISALLYSSRDVGPAGISRLVAMPHLFRRLPRRFQDRTAYRAIRPAGAGWLQPRLKGISMSLGKKIVAAAVSGSRLRLTLDDGSDRLVDHALLATGFRVDASRYSFLSPAVLKRLSLIDGYPILKRGLESSVPGLHFLGKPAAWSFGPLLGFVSGAEFASNELVRSIKHSNSTE
jgi:FAD-dependent urate hydroxylase